MKRLIILSNFILIFFISFSLKGQTEKSSWPVLKTYDKSHINKIAMPVGGIGTGTISLTGILNQGIMSKAKE